MNLFIFYLFIFFLHCSNGFMLNNRLFNRFTNNFKYTDDELTNKKMISIAPGGTNGFYTLGVSSYIKQNFDLGNYVFSGASAGAWNALFMSFKHDPNDFINTILNIDYDNAKSILDIEYSIKNTLLDKYTDEDFNLQAVYIGVTTLERFKFKTSIYNDFENLHDAIDACIASSHIPFVTGGLITKYKNKISFDGGFSKNPYLDKLKPVIKLSHTMWQNKMMSAIKETFNNKETEEFGNISDVAIQKPGDFNVYDLYRKGFEDTKKNDWFLRRKIR